MRFPHRLDKFDGSLDVSILGREQRNAGAYPRSLPLQYRWGLTIGTQAADFQESKRRLQPLVPLKNPDWPDWPWRGVACGSLRRLGLRKLSGLQSAPLQGFCRMTVFQQDRALRLRQRQRLDFAYARGKGRQKEIDPNLIGS